MDLFNHKYRQKVGGERRASDERERRMGGKWEEKINARARRICYFLRFVGKMSSSGVIKRAPIGKSRKANGETPLVFWFKFDFLPAELPVLFELGSKISHDERANFLLSRMETGKFCVKKTPTAQKR